MNVFASMPTMSKTGPCGAIWTSACVPPACSSSKRALAEGIWTRSVAFGGPLVPQANNVSVRKLRRNIFFTERYLGDSVPESSRSLLLAHPALVIPAVSVAGGGLLLLAGFDALFALAWFLLVGPVLSLVAYLVLYWREERKPRREPDQNIKIESAPRD